MVRYLARVVLAGCLIALAGCDRPREAPDSLPEVSATASVLLVSDAAPAAGLAHVPDSPVDADAVAMVVAFEIISPHYYSAYLLRPIWPGGASGATIGVGYDLGHQIEPVIRQDWRDHARVDALAGGALITGAEARALVIQMRDIETRYPLAEQVFRVATVPRYWQATRRAFPGIEALSPGARGALFSLVYNRGSAMAGSRRTEMRAIRDRCVPAQDYHCIAAQLLAMRRLWRGTDIEAGMNRRREAEAKLALSEAAS